MSENKLNKIMADLIDEANVLRSVLAVFRSLNDNIDRINQNTEEEGNNVVMDILELVF